MMQRAPIGGAPDRLRFLALGDSYTIGEAVPPEARWPVLLADALRAHGFPFAAPTIIAQTGWTTDELSAAIDRADPQGPYDLVTLLIGVNNQYRGGSVAEYRTEFRALLHRAIGFAGGTAGRVVVVSIPDWSVTPFAANDRPEPSADRRGDRRLQRSCERGSAASERALRGHHAILPHRRSRPVARCRRRAAPVGRDVRRLGRAGAAGRT